MGTPRRTDAIRRLESARSTTELTTSILSATLQLVAFATIVRRTISTFIKRR